MACLFFYTRDSSSSGGLVTALVTSPLDVLRTRLQSDSYQLTSRSSNVSPTVDPSIRPSIRPAASGHVPPALNHIRETLLHDNAAIEWTAFARLSGQREFVGCIEV